MYTFTTICDGDVVSYPAGYTQVHDFIIWIMKGIFQIIQGNFQITQVILYFGSYKLYFPVPHDVCYIQEVKRERVYYVINI